MVKRLFLTSSLFAFLVSSPCWAILAPWYLFGNEVSATLGADPCVVAADLPTEPIGGQLKMTLSVCDPAKAAALNRIILHQKSFGDIQVMVVVVTPSGKVLPLPVPAPQTAGEAKEIYKTALAGNVFFADIAGSGGSSDMWVECKKAVVQYFSDDIYDLYKMQTDVAAKAFRDVLELDFFKPLSVGVTTSAQ